MEQKFSVENIKWLLSENERLTDENISYADFLIELLSEPFWKKNKLIKEFLKDKTQLP